MRSEYGGAAGPPWTPLPCSIILGGKQGGQSMFDDLGLFILRVVVGGIVLAHGLMKIGWPVSTGQRGVPAVRGVAGFFGMLGLWPPLFWAIVAVVAEIGGSLLMILGLGGPIGPGLVFGDMLIVTIVAHLPAGFWAGGGKQMAGWEFPIAVTAGALAVTLIGNGAWSLDALLKLTYPGWLVPVWVGVMILGDIVLLAIRATRTAPGTQ
jgi:putative oxidoreductase